MCSRSYVSFLSHFSSSCPLSTVLCIFPEPQSQVFSTWRIGCVIKFVRILTVQFQLNLPIRTLHSLLRALTTFEVESTGNYFRVNTYVKSCVFSVCFSIVILLFVLPLTFSLNFHFDLTSFFSVFIQMPNESFDLLRNDIFDCRIKIKLFGAKDA